MPTKTSVTTKAPRKTTAKKKTVAESGVELLPAPVADAVIDEVVAELNGLQRETGFKLARSVGGILLKRFYGGKVDAWRERGIKDSSFRKLAERAEAGALQMSASSLYRCVALVEMEKRLGVSAWKHITVSHARAVFGLPNDTQQKLIAHAEEKAWTVEQMERAAARIRGKNAGGRGRPPLPAFVKTVNKLGKFLEAGDEAFGQLDKIDEIEENDAKRLYRAVTGMKLKCEELQQVLAKRVPGIA